MIPPVIFGTRASLNVHNGLDASNELLFLVGFFLCCYFRHYLGAQQQLKQGFINYV